jgi:hypothetical protein
LIAIQIIPSKEHLIVHLFETKEENIAYCILEIIYESHLDDSIVKIIEKNKI